MIEQKDTHPYVDLSIVTTMYYSSEFIQEFYNRASVIAEQIAKTYEIIFVNDGSPDDSLEKAKAIMESDFHVRIVDLSRNFGHHRAIMVGLEYSRGQKIFLIDSDLEEEPNWLERFDSKMMESNVDVVFGVQNLRKGGIVKRIGGTWFWYLFSLISDVQIMPNVMTCRLMTRKYVDSVLTFRERELFLAGIFKLAGFTQIPIFLEKGVRNETAYTLRKRFHLLVNAVTSFSSKPLVFVFYLGLFISISSATAMLILVFNVLFFGGYLTGWASLFVSIWLLGGLMIFCLGLIGMYLAKVFQEVKSRPLSIVRNVFERDH